MGIMMEKTYRALRTAGAPEDQAAEAATELASFWNRLVRIEVVSSVTLAICIAILVKLLSGS